MQRVIEPFNFFEICAQLEEACWLVVPRDLLFASKRYAFLDTQCILLLSCEKSSCSHVPAYVVLGGEDKSTFFADSMFRSDVVRLLGQDGVFFSVRATGAPPPFFPGFPLEENTLDVSCYASWLVNAKFPTWAPLGVWAGRNLPDSLRAEITSHAWAVSELLPTQQCASQQLMMSKLLL